MTVDKREFLHDFREEAGEYLAKLNENLLLFNRNPEQQEYLQNLKKEIHNLKGSARMLGLNEIEAVSHSLEYVLEALNDKKLSLSPLAINSLFNSFDLLRLLVEKAAKEEKIEMDLNLISTNLEKISRNEGGLEIFPDELKKITESINKVLPNQNTNSTGEHVSQDTLKVKALKIEELQGLVGEIIIDKIKGEEFSDELRSVLIEFKNYIKALRIFIKESDQGGRQGNPGITPEDLMTNVEKIEQKLKNCYKEDAQTINHLSLIIDKLQEKVFSLRMLPISVIFNAFPRAVYDLAQHFNKKINLEIKGKETELDKKLIEIIKEPLIHLLRNAIDHGIEQEDKRKEGGKREDGKIDVTAWQEGDYVYISIADDGAGIDPKIVKEMAVSKKIITQEEADELSERELIYLVFRPNFSTSTAVTELSGRGVGLDIVRERVEDLKGEVNLDSIAGQGTRVVLKLPLTLTITSVLLVKCDNKSFAVPTANIEEITRISKEEIKYVEGVPIVTLNRRIIPVVNLKDVLGLPYNEKFDAREKGRYHIVVIAYGRQRKGFMVDELISEQKVVINNLGEYIGKIKNIAGATIMGNGDIVFLLHIPDLMRSKLRGFKPQAIGEEKKEGEIAAVSVRKTILVVEDSLSTREMEKNILETANFEVEEAVNGVEALEKLALNKIDLIITDIQMPVMDGLQFIEELKKKEEYKNTPVIVVTSLEQTEDKKRGLELGANAYILKSEFNQEKLIEMIETFTG